MSYVRLLRLEPGAGDRLIAEGDTEVAEDAERLIEEFRGQLDRGMWAAVPMDGGGGCGDAVMIDDLEELPASADTVIFYPRAAGGRR